MDWYGRPKKILIQGKVFELKSINFMATILRIATAVDASTLADMGAKTFEETWNFYYSPKAIQQYVSETYSLKEIERDLSDPEIIYYIVFQDEEPAGFVKLSRRQTLADWIRDNCIELCRIYVYKKFHDKKLGKLLMEESIALAKKESKESIVLGVWENNHRAVNFYTHFGFEQIGTHPFYLGEQMDMDWVMRKKII